MIESLNFFRNDLYVLRKSLNFANEKRAKVNRNTNKINEFKYFKRNFVVFESTFLINVEICLFLKHNIREQSLLINTEVAHDIFYKTYYYFLSYDVILYFYLLYLLY